MIQALGHLSKGPFSNYLQNLISGGDGQWWDLQKSSRGEEEAVVSRSLSVCAFFAHIISVAVS